MKTYCPWCHAPADFIDTITTYCPECPEINVTVPMNLVSRQTTAGAIAVLRAKDHIQRARETDPKNL